MKPDKILLELEAELLAIQHEKNALNMPSDLRFCSLDGYPKEKLEAMQEILIRQISCIQRIQAYIGSSLKGRSDIN